MADIGNTLEDMAPLERVPSHSADPPPKPELKVPVETLGARIYQQRRSFETIPTGPPGSGACYRQSRSNPKPHAVLISSPIPDESESAAAIPTINSADVDPLSLDPLSLSSSGYAEVSPTSGTICRTISGEYRRSTLSYFGYYCLPTALANRESIDRSCREAGYMDPMDKEKSRENSDTGPSCTGPATPASGRLEFGDNSVIVRHASTSSSPSDQGSSPPHSPEKSDEVTSESHPLEPWRRVGTELMELEPGQSPIDALFSLKDEGWVRSETGDSVIPDLSRKANYSPAVGEPAGCPRSPSIMAVTESVISHDSEERNASRTQSWVCSESDEEIKWQHRIAWIRKSWPFADIGNHISPKVDGLFRYRNSASHPRSRTSTIPETAHRRWSADRSAESEGYNRCPSLPLSDDRQSRHSARTHSDQLGNQSTWASRLNGWPFMDSALNETRATSKGTPNEDIWHGIDDSLREIMRALTVKMSPFATDVWDNLPSWGLVDTPEEITTGRFRDRGQCAVVAIHRFTRITQDSLLLLNQTRSLQMYEGTLCNEWESASTRALLAVLAAETSCNEYMNTIIQGEHERLPFTEARIAGDTREALRKRARVAYNITRKLRGIFSTLDMRLGWLSKDHDEKYERAVRQFDAAVEIDPTWWRGESKENILTLESILFDRM